MSEHPAYELFEELGRGFNTVVYRSYDLSLGREVAIKVLDESSRRDPRHRERFLREAQFLAQFEHDNVLRVHSVDAERGWIIMEMMKGTLVPIIAAGPSDPDMVRSVLKQTLDALAFLHEKNKVHGTVRPTNLLINDAGRVKLSEFEQTDAGGELRAPTGSKKYLAPELIRPEFGEFGPPLDLYCLGFTALELLKGPQFESLFPGTGKGAIDPDIAWLRWHSSPEDLAPAQKLVKGLPDDLARVLDRMLKKRVADRAQTAQEVLKDLADRPLVAVPVSGLDDDNVAAPGKAALAPGVVRTIASAPQVVLPPSAKPAPAAKAVADSKSRSSKPAAAGAKPVHPRFSKDWWNQQLGRPYVLYPLCALIIIGAVWFSFFRGGETPRVPVTFDIQPAVEGVEIAVGEIKLKRREDGTYTFPPGKFEVTFNKEGFVPAKQIIEVTPEKNKFPVKLEPVIKFIDVVVDVKPADAQVKVDGEAKSAAEGPFTLKLQEGKEINVEASREGFVAASHKYTTQDLALINNKVTIELQPEKPPTPPVATTPPPEPEPTLPPEPTPPPPPPGPTLPASLVAKPGAEIDTEFNLPVRALSAKIGDDEPLEFALVKTGTYAFGAAEEGRRPRELKKREVKIETPFYIALNEVTNTQYRKFFEAEGYAKAGGRWENTALKWAEFPKLDPEKNNLPVTNVSPEQAQAFCAWVGGRLPTEIEWESAVRGPQDKGFPFPWGSDEVTRERTQIFHGDKMGEGFGPVVVDKLTEGANGLGLMNALGNAAEWCEDSEKPGSFILRGCSFQTANIDDIRVTWRGRGSARGDEDSGIRVVIPLPELGGGTPVKSATPSTAPATETTETNTNTEGSAQDAALRALGF